MAGIDDGAEAGRAVRSWVFSNEGNGASILSDGWWGQEPWGVWASKQEASLAISGFGRDAREIVLTIEFTLPGPTAPNSKGEVSARVNGERVYSVFNAPNHRQTFSLRVARSLWNARETATISIYVDHLYNPKRDRGVADARTSASVSSGYRSKRSLHRARRPTSPTANRSRRLKPPWSTLPINARANFQKTAAKARSPLIGRYERTLQFGRREGDRRLSAQACRR